MIGIINFDLGNIGSIKNAIEKINEPYFLINKIEDFSKAKKLILPGVGSFKIGMKNLINKDFDRVIKKVVNEDKKPILGICLGMQLLALRGYEDGKNEGLNLIGGDRGLFSYLKKKNDLKDLKVKKEYLLDEIEELKTKNYLITDKFDIDYIETLIRDKFVYGKKNEKIYIIIDEND